MPKFKMVNLNRKWGPVCSTAVILEDDPRPYLGKARKTKGNLSWYWAGKHYIQIEVLDVE